MRAPSKNSFKRCPGNSKKGRRAGGAAVRRLRRLQESAIDLLRPGDVAMCTTRAYIRPLHVEYAVSKGINVFMEKPFASDPGGLHRMLRAAEEPRRRE
jgi:hypothetical protein